MERKSDALKLITSISLVLLFLCFWFIVPAYAGNDDGNYQEVGVWWINDYHLFPPPGLDNLDHCDEDAEGFYNLLISSMGYTGRFDLGDFNAWETDWEKSSVGGRDYDFVDTCDCVYFAGHGSPSSFFFGEDHDGDDNYEFRVHYTEVGWGDMDLEWAFISACEVLNHNTYTVWAQAFNDLHGITGFDTPMFDTADLGWRFALYGYYGYCIGDSWKYATEDDQPWGVWAAIYRLRANVPGWGDTDLYYEWIAGFGPDGVEITKLYNNWPC